MFCPYDAQDCPIYICHCNLRQCVWKPSDDSKVSLWHLHLHYRWNLQLRFQHHANTFRLLFCTCAASIYWYWVSCAPFLEISLCTAFPSWSLKVLKTASTGMGDVLNGRQSHRPVVLRPSRAFSHMWLTLACMPPPHFIGHTVLLIPLPASWLSGLWGTCHTNSSHSFQPFSLLLFFLFTFKVLCVWAFLLFLFGVSIRLKILFPCYSLHNFSNKP